MVQVALFYSLDDGTRLATPAGYPDSIVFSNLKRADQVTEHMVMEHLVEHIVMEGLSFTEELAISWYPLDSIPRGREPRH